jgi:hypothetical protein
MSGTNQIIRLVPDKEKLPSVGIFDAQDVLVQTLRSCRRAFSLPFIPLEWLVELIGLLRTVRLPLIFFVFSES